MLQKVRVEDLSMLVEFLQWYDALPLHESNSLFTFYSSYINNAGTRNVCVLRSITLQVSRSLTQLLNNQNEKHGEMIRQRESCRVFISKNVLVLQIFHFYY